MLLQKQPKNIKTDLIKEHISWNLNITSCHLHIMLFFFSAANGRKELQRGKDEEKQKKKKTEGRYDKLEGG